jgi:thiol:disulfide interchange protein DsbA
VNKELGTSCFQGLSPLKKMITMPPYEKVRKMKMRYVLMATLLLLIPVVIFAVPEGYQEDVHYKRLDSEQSGADGKRIQVQGFFMYACGHCNDLEPHLEEWMKSKPDDVDFIKIPGVFNRPIIVLHAKLFYALSLIGADAEIHSKIFHAIHEEKKRLRTEEEVDAFLEANGVNMEEYRKAVKSFAVQTNVRKASVLAESYGIRGVPALIVDGKYIIPGQKQDVMTGAMNYLIEKVRKEKAGAPE